MFDFSSHVKHRTNQYKKAMQRNNQLLGLSTIELCVAEACNRKCSFCPRANPKLYPNLLKFMDLTLVRKLSKELGDFDFHGNIHLCGFGEPLLHKDIVEIVSILRKDVPLAHIEITTNGDVLTPNLLRSLNQSGLSLINIDCYDSPEQVGQRLSMLEEADFSNFRIREHYLTEDVPLEDQMVKFGYNNRAGALGNLLEIEEPLNKKCYYPFYRLTVDWDGSIVLCCNDWNRSHGFLGDLNTQSLAEIWLSDSFKSIRSLLIKGQRTGPACSKCNVNGELFGKESVDVLKVLHNI